MKKYFFITLALISFNTFSGHETGNGGDYYRKTYGDAWFRDEAKTIKVCFELSPQFKLNDEEKLKDYISYSMSTWKEYLKKQNIDARWNSRLKITTNFQVEIECNGSEDLTFYFGVINPLIKKDMTRYYRPMAFSSRTKAIKEDKWTKGYVWVQVGDKIPDFKGWSASSLKRILLHEVGHIYGNDHVSETIMRKDIAHAIVEDQHDWKGIDGGKELFHCQDCERINQNIVNLFDGGKAHRTIEKITGKKVTSQLTYIRYKEPTYPFHPDSISKRELQVMEHDGNQGQLVKIATIPFSVDQHSRFSQNDNSLFKGGPIGKYTTMSATSFGSLKTVNGEILNLIIEYNVKDNPYISSGVYLRISVLEKGKKVEIVNFSGVN